MSIFFFPLPTLQTLPCGKTHYVERRYSSLLCTNFFGFQTYITIFRILYLLRCEEDQNMPLECHRATCPTDKHLFLCRVSNV
jgi:hypothetical protein